MTEVSQGCSRPASKVIVANDTKTDGSPNQIQPEVKKMSAKVGAKAPDFSGTAYYRGGFKPVTLSEYLGKWVVLCFYPGDFTFV